jgi:hypothetical protein
MPGIPSRQRWSGFLLAALAVLVFAVAGCGGGESAAQINAKVDADAQKQQTLDGALAARVAKQQKTAALRAANQAKDAKDREKQLDQLNADQAAAAKQAQDATAGVDAGDISSQPLSGTDPAEEKFRAKVSGVCAGTQKRITAISNASKKAVKSKDPAQLLAVAHAESAV